MIRSAALCLFLALPAAAADAACAGRDLLPTLDGVERARITAAVDALDHGRGNRWRATRGEEVIQIVGTYHFDDPRHEAVMDRLAPAIDAASVVLVEAGPEEMAALQAEMARRPDRLFSTAGPTLPERLEEADWQALSVAMQARGVPAFMAAKMQPWYVAMLLGIPSCAMEDLASDPNGLDARVIARAAAQGVPVRALEPYDTVFTLFDSMSAADQIDMIRTTLAMVDAAEDYAATLTAAYFAEDVRVTWELGRITANNLPGQTPEKVDADLARMEELLMARRNRSWIPQITAAAAEGPVFAAFGALHLSGQDGVLALLEREGFALERLPF
ncbi:MAG: TraB/GumN family protein [Rhodobacteraceae bacterium]|jgi:uncharacterized protein YbaP (TraB family)|uniref:TraB/GumN family protein n=1 Tax=Albidovulum sp. TaxID=1872424 RepID=UPI001DDE511E|nr:TraB/GumN family protein [uncultured Defluviimonas sp.]MCB2125900.1 TraB/GumN family protein [Paracoccaceae bacterium]MCC0069746.1 TraB/GumN family protein [Paracoccaceae bacterium]